MYFSNLKILSGTRNPELARKICDYLGVDLGGARVERFPDGESIVKLDDDVRGRDVFVIQPTSPPVNEALMELLIFIDCLRRASAQRITAVMPYFGYARQDRKAEGRTPITAKLVANIITTAGAHRVLAMDLHAAQVQGFFDIPVDHLLAEPVLTAYFQQLDLGHRVVVSPDVGNVQTASVFQQHLGGSLAIINKQRVSGSETIVKNLIGDVNGKTTLMFDDMITTAGTVCEASKFLRDRGATAVYVAATHAVFADQALKRIADAPIDQIVVTDTIPVTPKAAEALKDKLKVLSVSELLGEAIRRIHRNESVSGLFRSSIHPLFHA